MCQCAEIQSYWSRFGTVRIKIKLKLPYVLCSYWNVQHFLFILLCMLLVVPLIWCSYICSTDLCGQPLECCAPALCPLFLLVCYK